MNSEKENLKQEVIKGKNYNDEFVVVDFKSFHECNFKYCTLIYLGSEKVGFQKCNFYNVNWTFAEYALNTIEFMRAIYNGTGNTGKEMIEGTFDKIRNNEPLSTAKYEDDEDDLIENLPESIGDYKKRILVIDQFVIIEYSKRALMMRHLNQKSISDELVKENLLFEVKARSLKQAYKWALNKMDDLGINEVEKQ